MNSDALKAAMTQVLKDHECGCETCAHTAALCPASSSSIIEELARLRLRLAGLPKQEHDNVWEHLLALKAGWDSYGAKTITQESIDAAKQFLTSLHVVPTNKGGIQLEWHSCGVDVEVEFGPDGLRHPKELTMSNLEPSGEKEDDGFVRVPEPTGTPNTDPLMYQHVFTYDELLKQNKQHAIDFAAQQETLDSWRHWHARLRELLGSKFNERNVTLEAAKELRQASAAQQADLEAVRATLESRGAKCEAHDPKCESLCCLVHSLASERDAQQVEIEWLKIECKLALKLFKKEHEISEKFDQLWHESERKNHNFQAEILEAVTVNDALQQENERLRRDVEFGRIFSNQICDALGPDWGGRAPVVDGIHELKAHYEAALANWNAGLEERDQLQQQLTALEKENSELRNNQIPPGWICHP